MADQADSTPMPERMLEYERLRSILRPLEIELTDARLLSVISTQVIEHTLRSKLPTGPHALEIFQITDEEAEVLRFNAYRAEAAIKLVQSGVDDISRILARRAGQ